MFVKTLLKMLDARQLSLKLIANVTYGYTGASYSGRMPCVEVLVYTLVQLYIQYLSCVYCRLLTVLSGRVERLWKEQYI